MSTVYTVQVQVETPPVEVLLLDPDTFSAQVEIVTAPVQTLALIPTSPDEVAVYLEGPQGAKGDKGDTGDPGIAVSASAPTNLDQLWLKIT